MAADEVEEMSSVASAVPATAASGLGQSQLEHYPTQGMKEVCGLKQVKKKKIKGQKGGFFKESESLDRRV
jgi:hypothetical protein